MAVFNSAFKSQAINITLLLLLFFGCVLFICPTDPFPLNDDWSYTHSVNYFNETGILDIGYWPAMNLVAHILWGSLFTKLFGFSHFVLRCSTFFLGAATLWLIYREVANSTKSHPVAFFATLFILFNPLWFLLSNTYMTDVPFLFSTVLAFFCIQKIVVQKKNVYLVIFALVCIYSILIRQFGLALSASLLGASVINTLKDRKNAKQLLLDSIPFFVSVITYLAFEKWVTQKLPSYAAYQSAGVVTKDYINLVVTTGKNVLHRYSLCMLYTGLFLCPLCIMAAVALIKKQTFKNILIIFPFTFIFLVFALGRMEDFPIGNILYNTGLGVESVYDITILNTNTTHVFSNVFVIIVRTIAVIGLTGLVMILVFGLQTLTRMLFTKGPIDIWKLFLVIFSIIYFLFLCISKSFFDRYALPLLVSVLLLLMPYIQLNAIRTGVLIGSLVFMGGFSVLCTYDYFNWNRARWQLVNTAIAKGADPSTINGGFEYAASRFYDVPWWGLWVGGDARYKVTFGPVRNHTRVTYLTYRRYIPYQTDTVFLYEKK